MIGLYLFQKYLDKLSDYDFKMKWQTKILPKSRNYFYIAVIYYIIAISIISQLLLLNTSSFFLGIVIVLFTAFIYGVYFIQKILRFIGKNNQRIISITFGQQTETFSKDNVVN